MKDRTQRVLAGMAVFVVLWFVGFFMGEYIGREHTTWYQYAIFCLAILGMSGGFVVVIMEYVEFLDSNSIEKRVKDLENMIPKFEITGTGE